MPDYLIRAAVDVDAASIAEIYNHYVRTSTATFDTEQKSAENRLAWLAEHGKTHPVLVAEDAGTIVGWGALSTWNPRSAYRHSAEISVYVAPHATQAGLGPAMSRALLARARELGYRTIISQIVSENEPSLKMARRLGFETVGTLRDVGRKFDRWLDVVLMELVLDTTAVEDPAS